jgi:hypothetical protein
MSSGLLIFTNNYYLGLLYMKHKKHVHMISVVIILIGAFLIIRSAIVGQIRGNIKDADFQEDVLQAQAGCTPPTLTNIHVENIASNGATIAWTTNQQSTSAVRLGLSSNSMSWMTTIHTPASTAGLTAHNYPLTNLQPGRTYFYRVRSSNGACQKTSPTYSFSTTTAPTGTPDITMPSTPANLAATNLTSTGVIIVWNASTDPVVTGAITSGVKGYELYGPTSACAYAGSAGYCGNVFHTGAASYSMSIQGLTPGNTYSGAVGTMAGFALKAYDNAGNYSSATPRLSVTAPSTNTDVCPNIAGVQLTVPTDMIIDSSGNCVLPPDTLAPSTPTNVNSPAKTSNSVSLAWSASTDNSGSVAGYRVYVNGSSSSANSSLITGTTYTASGLAASTSYSFVVKAFDAAGNASNGSPALSVTTTTVPDTAAPTRPTGLSSSNITSSSFVLNWTPSTDDTLAASQINYDVYGSNQACNVNAIAGYCGAVTGTTSMTITGLSPSTTYNATSGTNAGFVVQAYDNANHYSTASTLLSVTTIAGADTTPPTISNISLSSTSTSATVTWTTNEAATTYVDYGPTTAYGQVVNNTILSTSHSGNLVGLVAGNTYNYRVKSTDAAGNTAVSANLTFVAQAGPTACQNSGTVFNQRQMWIWHNESAVITPGSTEQNNLFNFIAAKDINMIYLNAPTSFINGNGPALRTFINTLWNSHCTQLQFLDGQPEWITPNYSAAVAWATAAKNFDLSIPAGGVHPYGLNSDVEPYSALSASATNRTNYINMYVAMKNALAGTNLKVVAVIPRWYDSTYGSAFLQSLINATDEISIMNYVTSASSFYSDASTELSMAQASGKKISLGIETIDLTNYGGGNGSTSFWPAAPVNSTTIATQCGKMTTMINTVYSQVMAAAPTAFTGFAIHDYYQNDGSGWKNLCP